MKTLYWLLPLLLLILFAPFSKELDLTSSTTFYEWGGNTFQQQGWPQVIFRVGILPAWILVFFAIWLFFSKKKVSKQVGTFLILCLAIGSGIIGHLILKDHWGRPRPRQITEFGGSYDYRPFYSPDFSANPPLKSFPSGHATMGFYFFSLFFVGKFLKKRWMAVAGVTFGLALGALLGVGRLAQGGHFFSDVVVSAILMWLTAYFLSLYVLKHERTNR